MNLPEACLGETSASCFSGDDILGGGGGLGDFDLSEIQGGGGGLGSGDIHIASSPPPTSSVCGSFTTAGSSSAMGYSHWIAPDSSFR